jgi:hypothetical protein
MVEGTLSGKARGTLLSKTCIPAFFKRCEDDILPGKSYYLLRAWGG